MADWEIAASIHAELGEGPVWDSAEGCLWFVDVTRCTVHRLEARSGTVSGQGVGRLVGAAIPRTDGGLALALDDGVHFAAWGTPGTRRVVPVGPADDPTVRLNDAKCDPRGRLWAGSMATDFRPGVSTLYRLGPRGAIPVITGCALANGMGWSPDGSRMYFVDSRRRIIEAFDYDLGSGEVSGRTAWLPVPAEHGWADGMTVDAEGGVWVAMYLGSAVRRYDPDGSLSDVLRFPVSKVTSVCFGGPDLCDLYVTSSSAGLSPGELDQQPHAGSVFVVPGAGRGQPSVRFDPSTINQAEIRSSS
jgi:sugar lactone lactonase YvrE